MRKSVDEQMKIITSGVETLINEQELRIKLEKSEKEESPLIIKLGLDPSAPDIHLGHAVVLRKIKQLQDLGHQAVIIIGDFTGRIGDPTGKVKGRAALSQEQVMENALTYQRQIFKVLDKEKTQVKYNSEWLGSLKFEEVIKLAATTTVARMMERDDFGKRYQNNMPIGIHEFFYPLMQAYDSVVLQADIELGGTDQMFNILMGRTLQKHLEMEAQIAMFMPILEGLDGVEKMSKSLGNYIGVNEDAQVMFKKVMEVPDSLIIRYFTLATDEHPDDIAAIGQALKEGANPRDIKIELAQIITKSYHGDKRMQEAFEYYNMVFGKKEIPENMPELSIEKQNPCIADIISPLVKGNYISSNSEFRRLVKQGGIQVNREKIADLEQKLQSGDVIKIGKKKFVRIKI
jgi:tyrosyl-tRNA synthetase